jgi:hypothetical protein
VPNLSLDWFARGKKEVAQFSQLLDKSFKSEIERKLILGLFDVPKKSKDGQNSSFKRQQNNRQRVDQINQPNVP